MPRIGTDEFPRVIINDGAGHYLKLPSLTTAQRNALTAAEGMTIFNSTTNQVEVCIDSTWRSVNYTALAAHAALTTGIHGAGSDHLALFGVASQVVSKVVWKDVPARALIDVDRTTLLNYTDLDLTAYTSANAKFAIAKLLLVATTTGTSGQSWTAIRKNGTTPSYYIAVSAVHDLPNGFITSEVSIVGLDAGQIIEYTIVPATGATLTTHIDVLGYIE
jgi:hypothetical protein